MLSGMQDELRDAVLLVFANKQDLPNAMNAAEITEKLGLHGLRQRHWWVASGCQRKRVKGGRGVPALLYGGSCVGAAGTWAVLKSECPDQFAWKVAAHED